VTVEVIEGTSEGALTLLVDSPWKPKFSRRKETKRHRGGGVTELLPDGSSRSGGDSIEETRVGRGRGDSRFELDESKDFR